MQTVMISSDPVCPVGYINFTKLRLIPKTRENELDVVVKKSIDYISDLNESSYSDLSDPDLSETELEHIEMENRMKESMSKDEIAILSRSNSLSQGGSGSVIASPVRVLTKNVTLDDGCSNTNDASETNSNGVADATKNHDTCDGGLNASPVFRFEIERRAIPNEPNVAINNKGWMWISGIHGVGATSKDGMLDALDKILKITSENGYELNNLCYITLYVRSMADYAGLNEIYAKAFNFTNPPTRVCVECPLRDDQQVIMEAVAFRARNNDGDSQRHTMHVQSISHWGKFNYSIVYIIIIDKNRLINLS